MLVVRERHYWTHAPRGYVVIVQLSDGRVFEVENNSGYRVLRGVPDEDDVLFWHEWREYVECVFNCTEDDLNSRQYIAWVSFLDHPARRIRARRPERIEAFTWALAYILANGEAPVSVLVEKALPRLQVMSPDTPRWYLRWLVTAGVAQALRRARYWWKELLK